MEASADPTDGLTLGGVPVVVYIAMFGATLGGQIAGVVLDAIAGNRVLWVPAMCSVVFEAVVGARMSAARLGRPLAAAECARLSAYYSLALAAVSLPLFGWTRLSQASHEGSTEAGGPASSAGALAGMSAHGTLGLAALVLAAFAVATVARFAIMRFVSPRAPSASPERG